MKKIFLEHMLPPNIEAVGKASLSEVVPVLKNDSRDVVLLVIDNDIASRTESRSENRGPKGRGAEFVNRHIIGAKGIVYPTIVTYRSYDIALPRLRDITKRIECVKDTDFTREKIRRKLEEWDIPLAPAPKYRRSGSCDLFDRAIVDQLEDIFAPMLEAPNADKSWDCVWEIADQLDASLGKRDRGRSIIPPEDAAERVYEWLLKVPAASQTQMKDADLGRYTRFLLLQAELLWSIRPVSALYLLVDAISTRIAAGKEPLGQHAGEGIYQVACRIQTKIQARSFWRFEIFTQLFKLPRLRVGGFVSHSTRFNEQEYIWSFDYVLWHDLIRTFVSHALKQINKNTNVLIDLERKMSLLRRQFEENGNAMGALEIEARTCEMRKHRLNVWQRIFSIILEYSCDYGNRPGKLFAWCFGIVVGFALLYEPMFSFMSSWLPSWLCIRIDISPDKAGAFQWAGEGGMKALYFSVESFLNLGYGDFSALNTIGRIVVCLEGLLGLSAFGLLIAVVSTKLRPR